MYQNSSTKTYAVCTQKNRLNEPITNENGLNDPKQMLKLMGKKILTGLRLTICVSKSTLLKIFKGTPDNFP